MLSEIREKAHMRIALYKAGITKVHSKRVSHQPLKLGGLVLRSMDVRGKHPGRFDQTRKGATSFSCWRGKEVPNTWHVDDFKCYYALISTTSCLSFHVSTC